MLDRCGGSSRLEGNISDKLGKAIFSRDQDSVVVDSCLQKNSASLKSSPTSLLKQYDFHFELAQPSRISINLGAPT